MTSFFDEIYEDEDVREANNAQKLMWWIIGAGLFFVGGMFLGNWYLATLL